MVVSDEGAVYRDGSAWIMCLFALEEYRDWANRLAHPLLRPLARQAFALLSQAAVADLALAVPGQRGRDRRDPEPGQRPGLRVTAAAAPDAGTRPDGAVALRGTAAVPGGSKHCRLISTNLVDHLVGRLDDDRLDVLGERGGPGAAVEGLARLRSRPSLRTRTEGM